MDTEGIKTLTINDVKAMTSLQQAELACEIANENLEFITTYGITKFFEKMGVDHRNVCLEIKQLIEDAVDMMVLTYGVRDLLVSRLRLIRK